MNSSSTRWLVKQTKRYFLQFLMVTLALQTYACSWISGVRRTTTDSMGKETLQSCSSTGPAIDTLTAIATGVLSVISFVGAADAASRECPPDPGGDLHIGCGLASVYGAEAGMILGLGFAVPTIVYGISAGTGWSSYKACQGELEGLDSQPADPSQPAYIPSGVKKTSSCMIPPKTNSSLLTIRW